MPADAQFRSIRVFVSSTFRDMQLEREELVKQVFPVLRRLCETRGVAWSEVDLRWGVTDEQKAEGSVLPICLAEIDRSRPYFIGLLGQRYGWIPEALPEGLADQLPWLADLRDTSVTEMEILHGVLNDPLAAKHAYFYTRDPAWVDTRSFDERLVLGEVASEDDVALLGAEAAGSAAAARRQRLEELKARVRDAGLATWQYPDPLALGERVLADFTALVDELFPEHEMPDALDRDAEAHRAFGRAQVLGHEQRVGLQERLDVFASGIESPLVVTGEPGAGAASIVSAWVESWRAAHPDDTIIEHHVGATASSTDWIAMAGRIIAEIDRVGAASGAATEPPADPAGRRTALFAALARAGARVGRTVLLVDGVDLLDDADGARSLTWLPRQLPPGVRVVVTSASPDATDEATRRGWGVLEIPALDEGERRALIHSFLGRYAKGLDPVHVARLVGCPSTGNTLYLRTVLDELRQHGDHFTLGVVIEHYLAAPTLEALLALVLGRYERDFERDRPGLVGDAMRCLWAARRGLTEPELLDALSTPERAVVQAMWSPLMLAGEAGLVTANGMVTFATEPHRLAVEHRYVVTASQRADAHAVLARTFAGYALGPRVVDELAWQQLGAGDLDGLFATVSNLAFTDAAYRRSHADLRRLWRRVEEAGRRIVDGYCGIIADPSSDPEMAWQIARLITDAGYPAESAALNQFLVDHYRRMPGDDSARRLPAALVNHGVALMGRGDLVAAEAVLQEAINLSRSRADLRVLQAGLGDLALCRRDRGDLDGAAPLFAEEESLCRRSGDSLGLQASLGNRAQLLRQRGENDGALALMAEQEDICRSIGDAVGVTRALSAQAAVLVDTGRPADALGRFTAYREVCEQLGDLRGAAEASISESDTLRQLGRRDDAAVRAASAEGLIRRLGDGPLLARILDARSRAAIEERRWTDANRLSTEAVLTARSSGAQPALVLALGMLGTSRRELGDLAGAREAHTEEEAIGNALGDIGAVATAQINLAAVDVGVGDLQSALGRYARAEPVMQRLGAQASLAVIYGNRWQVHATLGDSSAAISDMIAGGRASAASGALQQSQQLLSQAVEHLYASGRMNETESVWADIAGVARSLGDDATLQRAIGERALLVMGRGDTVGAATLFEEQEAICRRTGDQVGLAACVGNRAILLRNTGDLAGAMGCIDEQVELARETGNGQSLLFATANRGEVLGAMGRVLDGLAALSEARSMAANWNIAAMVQQLDEMIATMRAGQQ